MPYYGVKLNTSFTNEFNQVTQTIINTGSWETTIGPVKKDFISELSVIKNSASGSSVDNFLKITLSIEVSKNGSPFAQKILDDNNSNSRIKAAIHYSVE